MSVMSDIHIEMSCCEFPVYKRIVDMPSFTLWGFDYTSYKTGETVFVGLSEAVRGLLFATSEVEVVPPNGFDHGISSDLLDELCDWQAGIADDVNSEIFV